MRKEKGILFLFAGLFSALSAQAADEGRTTSYRYTALGLIEQIDGPRTDVSDITSFEYDSKGNRIAITNALGQITEITAHDGAGRPLTIVDPNGITTQLAYDPRGRLISSTKADRTTAITYDAVGNVTGITQPDGSFILYEYDAANRLTGLEDGAGNRIDYSLDAMGNRLESRVSDPEGQLTRLQRHTYDALGRLIADVGANAQTARYNYDPNGNLTGETDANQNSTAHGFDALNRLINSTDPLNGQAHLDYDAQDNLVSVTDPRGLTTHYTYDAYGNLINRQSPDTGHSSYAYDEADNQISGTDARGVTVDYTYDALDRLVQAKYPDSTLDTKYQYDQGVYGVGRLTGVEDGNVSIQYKYDALGNIISKSETHNSISLESAFTYDSSDRLSGITYPSGNTVHYQRNANGDIERISFVPSGQTESQTLLDNITHAPFGPVTGWQTLNGQQVGRTLDLDHQLTGISGPLQYQYQYDPVGNISSTIDEQGANATRSYTYDRLNRLTDASGEDGSINYSYDASGNRIQLTQDGNNASYQYAPDSHRLLEISSTDNRSLQYDEAGNLTNDGTHSYSYDARGRLVSVDDDATARYLFNPLGERVLKSSGSGSGTDYAALAKQYEQKAQAHRDTATALNEQAAQKRAAATEATDKAAELTQQAADLRAQSDQNRSDAAQLQEETDELSSQISGLLAEAKIHEEDAAALRKQAATLEDEIDALESQAETEKQAAEAAEQQAMVHTQAAQQLLSTSEQKQEQATQKEKEAEDFTEQSESLGQSIEEQRSQLVTLEQEIEGHRTRIEEIEGELSTRRTNIADYEIKVSDVRDQLEEITSGWRSWFKKLMLMQKIAYYQAKIQMERVYIALLEAVQNNEQSQADQKLAEVEALRGQITANEQKQEELAQQAQQLTEEAKGLLAEVQEAQQQAQQEQELAQTQTDKAQHHHETIAALEVETSLKQQALTEVNTRIDQSDQKALALRTEAGEKQNQVNAKQAEINELNAEADQLTAQAETKEQDATEQTQLAAQYTQEAESLTTQAESEANKAETVQQQADEYSALAEQNPGGVGQVVKRFFYDTDGKLLGEYDESGALQQEIVYLHALPVILIHNGQYYDIHTDHLGTPRAISDANNTVVWRWDSAPFGRAQADEDPDGDGNELTFNLRFPGQYYDSETGLHYNYFRDYDPSTGRYIQSDPIGLGGGLNTYAYADGNPVSLSDPLGLATYMCMKPLDFLTQRGWDNTGKRTGVENMFNPAHHQYLCVKNGNVEVCGGQDLDRSKEILPGYGEGKPSNDKFDQNRCEQIEPDRQCIEQCVIRKIQNPKRPFYGVLGPGTNCQEWAIDAIWDCRKECSPW